MTGGRQPGRTGRGDRTATTSGERRRPADHACDGHGRLSTDGGQPPPPARLERFVASVEDGRRPAVDADDLAADLRSHLEEAPLVQGDLLILGGTLRIWGVY
jgi:hypothetical protein